MSKRRVLRVITRLNIGGPARQALLLSHLLADRFPTTLIAGTPAPLEGELQDDRVAVHRVPLVRPVAPATDRQALVALRAVIRDQSPFLVHSHMAKAGALSRIAGSSVHPRPRMVHTYHGHVLDGYFAGPVERAFILAERALARVTDVLIAVSPEVRDSLLEMGIGRPSQYRVIPLGLDISAHLAVSRPSGLLRQALRLDHETPLIVAAGRLAPVKDYATLIEAVARVPRAHLALLGDGEMREDLERLVQSLALQGRVHLVGWWKDMAAALSDADVVALSSRNEGTPVTLIEAQACARPVVATNVGGVGAVVRDEHTGFLVRPGDPAAMAGRLRTLLEEPALRWAMGSAGRQQARRFTADRLAADIAALYEELRA